MKKTYAVGEIGAKTTCLLLLYRKQRKLAA